jgi:hypothetical protein
LEVGDNKTKVFHAFTTFWKNNNTIWEIIGEDKTTLSLFGDKVEAGAKYFENFFKALPDNPIQEILGVVQKFS